MRACVHAYVCARMRVCVHMCVCYSHHSQTCINQKRVCVISHHCTQILINLKCVCYSHLTQTLSKGDKGISSRDWVLCVVADMAEMTICSSQIFTNTPINKCTLSLQRPSVYP